MLERFTQAARDILFAAQDLARAEESPEIEPKHFFEALSQAKDTLAGQVLGSVVPRQVPFSPETSLGHNYVGTEHLLLALFRFDDAEERFGVHPEVVRNELIRRLSGPGRKNG